MSSARSDNGRRDDPLTAGERFIRGFRRIGLVAAALVSLVGVAITLFVTWTEYDTNRRTFESATCVAKVVRTADPTKIAEGIAEARAAGYSDDEIIDYLSQKSSKSACSTIGLYGMAVGDVLAIADGGPSVFAERALGIGLVVTGVSALAVLLLAWTIGWLCAGFTRD
jgi:hypothetical protein